MLIMVLAVVLAAHQAPSSAITPKLVERMISRYGAQRTVAKLVKQGANDPSLDLGQFDVVLEGISSGDPRWLALVAKLEPGIGGLTSASESLPIVIAEALPKNPIGVLRLFGSPRWLRDVCSYPMIEPTKKEARIYFKAAIPAVSGVRDPKLQRAKKVCLTALIKAQQMP